MTTHRAVVFFDAQSRKQVQARQVALAPFEDAVLPHLTGGVVGRRVAPMPY